MSQAVLDSKVRVTVPPPPPRQIPKSYPDRSAQSLPAPARGGEFDRAAFASPRIDRPMYNGEAGQSAETPASPDRFAARVVGQSIEVLMGHRPARQLQTWMHPDVYEALIRRAGLGQRVLGRAEKCMPPRIKRVRVCEPRKGVAEVSLVVFDGKRTRAAAARLEVRRGRWHVTALEII
ncbi:MAG: Rv3235 family protein [Trueperella sp.]|uniref:Rv3235 family protein n=1 Tax=Trueperella TaxID=1069494 RepID=UPI0026014C2F|nr:MULTISPECIES: Rv3235 family protein [Trueperella]MCI7304821.1 Rv3235 family protein [Trueperella sp.]MDY5404477.1 Rv3235 family protein [Trueperella sp.]